MKKGFTLIELLVVIAILGVLATVGISSFRNSQIRARDAKRKSDLEQIQRALEMYFSDKRTYPTSVPAEGGTIGSVDWGGEFVDPDNTDTLYMKEVPQDPKSNPEYCYLYVASPLSYKIYARLENTEDPVAKGNIYTCGANTYNYGVSSSNSRP